MLRSFPFVPGDSNTSPDRQRSVERAREPAERYANITGTDERRGSRSRSGTPRSGTPSQQAGPFPRPVFLPAAAIPQVQIPASYHAPLRNPMSIVPPLPVFNTHGQGQEHGSCSRTSSTNPLPQGHELMDLDDPFGPPLPLPIPMSQRHVVNLDDHDDHDVLPAPIQHGHLQNHMARVDPPIPPSAPIPASIPIPPPMPIEDVNGLGMTAHNPAHIVGGVHHGVGHVWGERHPACQPHPTNPNKLWCTTGSHYVLEIEFGPRQTCEECRRKHRERAAMAREQELQQAAQTGSQVELQDQIDDPVPNEPAPAPEMQNDQNGDPLLASAISAEDKIAVRN